jgi:hypothetical protein
MASTALVLGGACNVWDDVDRARELFQWDIVVAANHVGINWPHELHHWCSYHPALLNRWILQRTKNGLPPAENLWTGRVKPRTPFPECRKFAAHGGSSGMLAALIAAHHADRVVLAGIPMDPTMPHFHGAHSYKPWDDGRNYLRHWRDNYTKLEGRVKSLSGWTKELLGEPTEEWLKGG